MPFHKEIAAFAFFQPEKLQLIKARGLKFLNSLKEYLLTPLTVT